MRRITSLHPSRNLDPKQSRPSAYVEGLWGFLLNELPGGSTRLVIGGYQAIRPRSVGRLVFGWFYIPVVWIMQARMLTVLKRNIQRAASAPQHAITSREMPTVGSKKVPATGRANQSARRQNSRGATGHFDDVPDHTTPSKKVSACSRPLAPFRCV